MKSQNNRTTPFLFALLITSLSLGGCASLNNTEKGAVIGAGAGGAVGAVIGNKTGSTARGAIIGAAVGGAAGAVIGRRMDKTAEELEESLDGATVERVGEGILVSFESGILFDFDSSQLRSLARGELTDLANSLEEFPETELLVVGHTDDVGSDSYNLELSRKRARAAADQLRASGITSDRLVIEGRGESEPVASNTTDAGRQQNRRVEVAIFASEEYRDQIAQRHRNERD